MEGETKNCPQCVRAKKAKLTECNYCGRDLRKSEVVTDDPNITIKRRTNWVFVIIWAAFILYLVFALFMPMLVGSLPLAVVVWLAFFWSGHYLVAAYQRNRLSRRLRRAAAR